MGCVDCVDCDYNCIMWLFVLPVGVAMWFWVLFVLCPPHRRGGLTQGNGNKQEGGHTSHPFMYKTLSTNLSQNS